MLPPLLLWLLLLLLLLWLLLLLPRRLGRQQVQEVQMKKDVVTDPTARHKGCLGLVDDQVERCANAPRDGLGHNLVVSVEQGDRPEAGDGVAGCVAAFV